MAALPKTSAEEASKFSVLNPTIDVKIQNYTPSYENFMKNNQKKIDNLNRITKMLEGSHNTRSAKVFGVKEPVKIRRMVKAGVS